MSAKISIEMTSDERKAFVAFQKMKAQVDDLQTKLKGARSAGVEAAERIDSGFSKSAATAAKMVGGMAAVTAGIAAAQQAMQAFKDVTDAAGERLSDVANQARALFQLQGGADLKKAADAIRVSHGLDAKEAHALTFTAASAGDKYLAQLSTIASLKDLGMDPEAAITGQQKVEAAFGRAFTTKAYVDRVLAAAGPSNVRADSLAAAMSVPAVSAANIGWSVEELFAAGSVLSNTLKSPDTAAEHLKSLATQLERSAPVSIDMVPGFMPFARSMNLRNVMQLDDLAKVKNLFSGGKPVTDVNAMLSESNAKVAFMALNKQERLVLQRINEIEQSSGLTDRRLAEVHSVPEFSAEKAERVAIQRRELGLERDYGTAANLADALQAEYMRKVELQKPNAMKWMFLKLDTELGRFLQGDERFLRLSRHHGAGSPGLSRAIDQYLGEPSPAADIGPGFFGTAADAYRSIDRGQPSAVPMVTGDPSGLSELKQQTGLLKAILNGVQETARRAGGGTAGVPVGVNR